MGKVYNINLLGTPGTVTRSIDNIINGQFNAESTNAIEYGKPLIYDPYGVKNWTSTATVANFAGISVNNPSKTPDTYGSATGHYLPGEVVDVLTRGNVIIHVSSGTPVKGTHVHVVKATGLFVASADGANTEELTNCVFTSLKDSNGNAEILVAHRNTM